jgi:hypothetical protein
MPSRVFGKFSGQALKELENIYTLSRLEYSDAEENTFFFTL